MALISDFKAPIQWSLKVHESIAPNIGYLPVPDSHQKEVTDGMQEVPRGMAARRGIADKKCEKWQRPATIVVVISQTIECPVTVRRAISRRIVRVGER
ncbi:hypothetical protein J6590_008960 [Homalodisca vitripennis]|nr:hypothetical protein J6590_008960 [Homalodisca vitripennis]